MDDHKTFIDRAKDPLGFPSVFDHAIRTLIADGYTDAEVLDEAINAQHRAALADQRLWATRIAAIRRELTPRRRPGQPGWTDEVFREHWREAIGLLSPTADRTIPNVAANFRRRHGGEIGVDPEHLRELHRAHGSPPFE